MSLRMCRGSEDSFWRGLSPSTFIWFFMQATKHAGRMALLAELSLQPSIRMSADVETKPVRFMHLQKQRTTLKKN